MKKVLVTGSAGFIGLNLVSALSRNSDLIVFQYDLSNPKEELYNALNEIDLIFHLAGVNRPQHETEFATGNVDLTQMICEFVQKIGRSPKIVLSSSTQADLDNPYGASKKAAEEVLKRYHDTTGADVAVYRLPGVFGKWSRPNYNTVIATFCNNIARDLPIQISDETNELHLVYIDDVVRDFQSELILEQTQNSFRFAEMKPVYSITLGKLDETIRSFRESRDTLMLPEMSDRFTACLYATYLSFLPKDGFSYQLPINEDDRGALAEFIKSPGMGQIFVSRTKPGITRGNHYHHTKVEKFLVLEGEGIIRFRKINSDEILNYPVNGREFKVVDIPPGFTHSIENVGVTEMIVLFWAGEIYDQSKPDTEFLSVLK